jgi:tRNA(Ile)-lysidine synthase
LRYHVPVHSLAQRVLSHTRRQELLHAGDRVGVAVSGGIDSVALLRLLLELRGELGIVLSIVHFNHKLRGTESDADQEFVTALARAHDLEFFCDSDDVARQAAEDRVSVEAAAREFRYRFFRYLLGEDRDPPGLKPLLDIEPVHSAEAPLFHVTAGSTSHLNKIATGHTLDDQAETVLMRIIRGAGLRGLGGIHPRILVEDDYEVCGEILRPLLAFRRRELEHYLCEIGQNWREDSTNSDTSFTRNRVRKLLVPLLEKEFNPSIAENIAELAEIARGEEEYWENEVSGWMGTAVHWSVPAWARAASGNDQLVQIAVPRATARTQAHTQEKNDLRWRIDSAPWLVMNASVDRLWFLREPTAVQRRLVKAIGEEAGIPLAFKHVEEILRFAEEDGASNKELSLKELSLPLGWKVMREPDELLFITPDLREQTAPQDYEYALPVPGQIAVLEVGLVFEAQRIPGAAIAEYNPDHLLDAESLPGPLTVRNWRPGDRFWPVHTKSPKKIKELLQERHVGQPERKLWPVIVTGKDRDGEIVWVRGFPVSAKFRARPRHDAIRIRETPLTENA